MRRVVVHIEELRLRGFNETDGAGIREALCRELTGVLAEPGARADYSDTVLPQLTLPQVAAAGEAAGSDIGAHIAQGICGRLTR